MFALKEHSKQGPAGTRISPAGLGCRHPAVEGKVLRTPGVNLGSGHQHPSGTKVRSAPADTQGHPERPWQRSRPVPRATAATWEMLLFVGLVLRGTHQQSSGRWLWP